MTNRVDNILEMRISPHISTHAVNVFQHLRELKFPYYKEKHVYMQMSSYQLNQLFFWSNSLPDIFLVIYIDWSFFYYSIQKKNNSKNLQEQQQKIDATICC